jgi:hypothetical protein
MRGVAKFSSMGTSWGVTLLKVGLQLLMVKLRIASQGEINRIMWTLGHLRKAVRGLHKYESSVNVEGKVALKAAMGVLLEVIKQEEGKIEKLKFEGEEHPRTWSIRKTVKSLSWTLRKLKFASNDLQIYLGPHLLGKTTIGKDAILRAKAIIDQAVNEMQEKVKALEGELWREVFPD